ncbi:hypothetical protein FSP39_006789 [Pinctada imbricata]|uniref:C1q domain-containing protein n=1 Tax=Pinctada imbricata TaxID=66713 RepID=A0AA88Y5B7_PINIB|nr:hypothetical protein FSP39_006789 [Pinctada imbricata]
MLCFPVVMSILAFQSVKCQSLLLGKPNVCNQDEAVREAIHNGKIVSQSAMVSFSTYKRTTLQTTRNKERIIFEEVRSNNGGGYDNSTGIFTVPIDGTYYFFVSILTTSPGEFQLTLKENPRVRDSMFLVTDTSGLVQTSNSVVVNMKAGDKVSVRTHSPRGPGIYTVYRY